MRLSNHRYHLSLYKCLYVWANEPRYSSIFKGWFSQKHALDIYKYVAGILPLFIGGVGQTCALLFAGTTLISLVSGVLSLRGGLLAFI